jgi:basic membrane protein A and related proteins
MIRKLGRLSVLLVVTLLFSFHLSGSSRALKVRQNLQNRSGKPIGEYRALVIGINNYKDPQIPDLKTAVNDATSVANLLKDIYGFTDVTLLLDSQADGSSIQKSLRRLATQSKQNDSVLIYYAGHGDLDKVTKDGWWIPHNAIAGDPFSYLDNSIIQKYIRAIPARHVLLVADSCFSGTLFGSARELPSVIDDKYYATLFKEKSRWGMTSGNLTPVTDRGAEGHSLFAYQFIKSLKDNQKPYLTPREIYQKIAPIIRNNSEQLPITKPIRNADDRGGEFIFIREVTQSEKPKPVLNSEAEDAVWEVIKNSQYAEDIQDYLSSYPNGKYSVAAKIKIRQLNRKKKPLNVAGGSVQIEDAGDGTANISTEPTGAVIYINNQYKGKSPFSLVLKPGGYLIRAQKEGYKPESRRISVKSAKQVQLTFVLDKQGGSLFIRSNPSSAKVYLNNQYQGESPLTLKGLDKGKYSLSLKTEGYSDYRRTVVIKQGRESQIIARLKKAKPASFITGKATVIPKASVGIVFDAGGKNDRSFNQSAWKGAVEARDEFGILIKGLEAGDSRAVEEGMRTLASEGYGLIFGVGFANARAIKNVAEEFPNTNFAIIDAVVKLPNVSSLKFKEHEGSFLVGMIAAMRSRIVDGERSIGFIGGMEIPIIKKFEAGFRDGARRVYPGINVIVNYVGNTPTAWNDPTKARTIARTQIKNGVSVIYSVAGGSANGLFDALKETNSRGPCYPKVKNRKRVDHCVYGIGVDSNQNYIIPGQILTSMLKRVDVAVFDTIKAFVNGNIKGGVTVYGIKNDGVGYALDKHNSRLISKKMVKVISIFKDKVINGVIEVPSR